MYSIVPDEGTASTEENTGMTTPTTVTEEEPTEENTGTTTAVTVTEGGPTEENTDMTTRTTEEPNRLSRFAKKIA